MDAKIYDTYVFINYYFNVKLTGFWSKRISSLSDTEMDGDGDGERELDIFVEKFK